MLFWSATETVAGGFVGMLRGPPTRTETPDRAKESVRVIFTGIDTGSTTLGDWRVFADGRDPTAV